MGHALPLSFLHQQGDDSFGNLRCVFLAQGRITAACHPLPKRADMHAAHPITAMKPHLFTSFLLLAATLVGSAATVSLHGQLRGPFGSGTSTLDFYWFAAEASGDVIVAGSSQSLPTNAGTAVGWDLKFYTRPGDAGQMPLFGILSSDRGGFLPTSLYLPAGQYLLAVLPGTSSFNGALPLPAVESNSGRLFVSIGYNGTIRGNVRLEEGWLGQQDGSFQITVIPEPHTPAVLGVLFAAALILRRRSFPS